MANIRMCLHHVYMQRRSLYTNELATVQVDAFDDLISLDVL